MYAIIETGGKQYRVQQGDTIFVEKLDAEAGAEVAIDKVLMLGGGERKIGAPYVEGASVKALVATQGRRPKVLVYKRRRRKDSKTMHGHRQDCTFLRIKQIIAQPGAAAAAAAADATEAQQ